MANFLAVMRIKYKMNKSFKNRFIRKRITIFILLVFCFVPIFRTWGMQSSNYRIDEDSINFGGTEESSSANYKLSDTMGEVGTGEMETGCSSLSFNGSSDYVNMGDINGIDGVAELTVTAWIKVDNINTDNDIAAKGLHNSLQPFLFWRDDVVTSGPQNGNTNCLSATVYDGDTVAWVSSPSDSVNDNNWHHVAFSFQSNIAAGLKVYVDGYNANSASTVNVNNIQDSSNIFTVGKSTSDAYYFDGNIDDVHIYSRALSSTEIYDLYQGKHISDTGMVGRWNFNEGSGSVANDVSGNSNNGSISGATFSLNYPASTCNILNAGYRQMDETYLAISSPADVTMSPAIGGVTGGTGNGSAVWNVKTDSPAGYQISTKASTSPALKFSSYSFADYTETSTGIPDYNWSVATADSEFGYTVEGSGAVLKFLDNGSSACNTGSNNTTDKCWYKFATSDFGIVSSSLPNHPLGTDTTMKFKAQSGSGHLQAEGSYTATITVTALAL